jgi:ATP-dependent DNA helicase RecQ
VIRQLLASGQLAVTSRHGTLAITEKAAPVLRGEESVLLRQDAVTRPSRPSRQRGGSAVPAVAKALDGAAQAAFERLRAWRLEVARTEALPAYVIFHDATLAAIAQAHPTTSDELAQISGVGARKLEVYGPGVLAVLRGEPVEAEPTDSLIDPDA